MDGKKLSKAIVCLFESKLKNYTEVTVKTWVELLKDFDENKIIEVIKKLVYSKEDFISIGMITEMIENRDYITEALEQWEQIFRLACGNNGKPNEIAKKTLEQFTTIKILGNMYEKEIDFIRQKFIKDYPFMAKQKNYKFIEINNKL